jgi:hypothetical protein
MGFQKSENALFSRGKGKLALATLIPHPKLDRSSMEGYATYI